MELRYLELLQKFRYLDRMFWENIKCLRCIGRGNEMAKIREFIWETTRKMVMENYA